MPDSLDKALHNKRQLRREMTACRDAQQNADLLSRQIWSKILALPGFAHARTVMTYLDFGGEVRTREHIPELWRLDKRVVIPYCTAHELHLFHLKDFDELIPGAWQILEPKPEWRANAERRVNPAELDLIIVPGLAFDRNCDRLGFGKGYYDRLLRGVRPDALKIAPAFDCQIVATIPVLPHDVRMDMVVTETTVYKSPSF
jgi:5-formyltetrahydrofolate cyclo-ligase